jgi:hypothetical protein
MKTRIWLIPLLGLLLLAACTPAAGSAPEGVIFRPIDSIIEGDLDITNFANGTASLPITTSVPVACTIVYGTTPEFGSLTLDLDMAGGAHSDHNPLLSGLEGSTTYYYRVQGVDQDGNIYISDVMTFSTPDFTAASDTADNLASPQRGATITGYSSIFGNGPEDGRWGVNNAFDGNPNTEWATAGDGSDAWVEVTLAGRAQLDAIEFWSRAMGDGSSITLAFTVTTDSGDMLGPFEVLDTNGPHRFEVDVEAATLRFDLMDTTGGNTGIVELVVIGEMVDG